MSVVSGTCTVFFYEGDGLESRTKPKLKMFKFVFNAVILNVWYT